MKTGARLSQIKSLRDAAVRLVAKSAFDSDEIVELRVGDLKIAHRSPSVARQYPNLSHGLDIWTAKKKVLNFEWAEDGEVHVASFHRGEWENTLLSHVPASQLLLGHPVIPQKLLNPINRLAV